MRSKNKRWLYTWVILWTYLQLLYCEANEFRNPANNKNGSTAFSKENRGLFSPRMDYEQWKPILNGDPLKNDPTFDYVPPMVEAVRYWRDTGHRKTENHQSSTINQNQKKDILVLGVSSKKPSTISSVPENPNRREYFDPFLKYVKETPYKETTYTYQRHRQHLPLTSPYFTPSNFLNKLTERPPINNEPIPYTMLLPPPVPSKNSVTTISETTRKPSPSPATFSSVTIDQANLIFQSSTSGLTDWLVDKYTTAESNNMVTWKTPPSQEPILSNIIDKQEKPSEPFQMKVADTHQIFSNKNGTGNNQEKTVQMHKGQVEDDDLDHYVNIGKLEAHMDSVSGIGISGVTVKPPNFGDILRPIAVPNLGQSVVNSMFTPKKPSPSITMAMEHFETMQTMQPPPVSITQGTSQFHSIKSLLQNEITQSSDAFPATTMITTTPKSTPMMAITPKPTTTTAASLTTDPLFKHYKQSMEPIRGPLYLIIQGHSKVKTYGPSKQIHGIAVQESNEIPTADDKDFNVKHLHKFKKGEESETPKRSARSGNLQTLKHVVQTRLGAIDFGKYSDFKEVDREVEYKVSSQEEDASEKYQKGIVEVGAIARKLLSDSMMSD